MEGRNEKNSAKSRGGSACLSICFRDYADGGKGNISCQSGFGENEILSGNRFKKDALPWVEKSKKTAAIKVKVKPKKASKKVSYKSSNKKVIKVTAKGKVTAVKPGKATVTVTSKAQKKFRKKLNLP